LIGPIAPEARIRYEKDVPYKDPERRREYGRDWIRRNADKAREAMRRWRAAHPEEHAKDSREDYARNRVARLQQSLAYHRAHPEVRKTSDNKRRVQALASGTSFTTREWLALVEAHAGRCAYCGEQASLQADHRVPLARGGSNSIDNILPACRRCNARKHLMTDVEFRARLESERREEL
jgi:5-methylcytosine-specific restriction endonuclease McrA